MKIMLFILIFILSSVSYLNASNKAVNKEHSFKLSSIDCLDAKNKKQDKKIPQSLPINYKDISKYGCHYVDINLKVDEYLLSNDKNDRIPIINLGVVVEKGEEKSTDTAKDNRINGGGTSEALIISNTKKIPTFELTSAMALPLLISEKTAFKNDNDNDMIFTFNTIYHKVAPFSSVDSVSTIAGVSIPFLNKTRIMAGIDAERTIDLSNLNNYDQMVRVNVGFLHSLDRQVSFFGSIGQNTNAIDGMTRNYLLFGLKSNFAK